MVQPPQADASATGAKSARKTVLVTGATGGIGTAVAKGFASTGSHLVLHHLGDAAAASQLAEEVEHMSRLTPVVVEGDISDDTAVRSMVSAADERLPHGLDVLVNTAGIMFERTIDDYGPADWRRVIDTNLTGTYLVTQEVLGSMIARGSGVIITVASQIAFKGAAGLTAYAASKGGVVGFTRALAREVGPAVRVYGVAPGPIDTPMIKPYADDAWVMERSGGLITKRLGQPHEVADVCLFLADDRAQLLQGQFLHCNGGGYMA